MEVVFATNMAHDDGVLVAEFYEGGADGGDCLADLFRVVWDVADARSLGG